MLEPRKRTALDGKTYWCVFNTDTMKWSTLTCFGKYTKKKDCQFAIDLCTKGEIKTSLENELEEILDDIGVTYSKYGYEIVDTKVVNDIKIGEKFVIDDNLYLRIDVDLNNKTKFTDFSNFVCVLDLNTYKIVCLNRFTEVDNR